MGCNFSSNAVRIIAEKEGTIPEIEISDADLDSLGAKSLDSSFSISSSIDSDKITLYSGSEFMHPHYHRSRSVDHSRKRSLAKHDVPPVAAATIIMNTSSTLQHSPHPHCLSDQHQDGKPGPKVSLPDITLNPPPKEPEKNRAKQRRSSESDLGKITNLTCISNSSALSNSNVKELKVKPLVFGPRNSRLTLTESQKDFFKMLDEKVAQGKDYSSEDEKSIASFRSNGILLEENSESHTFVLPPIVPEVR